MSEWSQVFAVVLIGAGALAYVLRQALRRLRPRARHEPVGCGMCKGCSGGGCGPGRR
jgi:hypothetical protein